MTASRMFRVQDGTLVPLDLEAIPATVVPQAPTDNADARQTGWERDRAYRALHQAEERLEMAGRSDMAREVRMIRSRFVLGR